MGFVLENLNSDPSILKNQSVISLFHDLRTEKKQKTLVMYNNANKMIFDSQ